MVSGFEITCANKNRLGVITRIGGDGWSMDIREAVLKLISQQLRLSVRVDNVLMEVGVRGEGQDSYLSIEPEGYPLHTLADLQSC